MTTRLPIVISAVLGTLAVGLFNGSHAAPDPDVQWQQTVTAAEKALARQSPESRELLEAALAFAKASQSDRRIAYTYDALASWAQDRGQYFEAEKHYRFSIYHWERAQGSAAGLARTLGNQASLLFETGRFAKAAEALSRADNVQAANGEPNNAERAYRLHRLGMVYGKLADYEHAETSLRTALAIWDKQRQSPLPEVAAIEGNLALVYLEAGRINEADMLFRQAEPVWTEDGGISDEAMESVLVLAERHRAAGRKAAAATLAANAAAFAEAAYGDGSAKMIPVLQQYAKILRDTKRGDEAKRLEKRAKDIAKHPASHSSADYTVDIGELRQKAGSGFAAEPSPEC